MPAHQRYTKYISDQREFFDALITEDWLTYISADWDASRRYEISKLFNVVKPSTVLDVGCGCGFHDVAMAEYPFIRQVIGIDNSEKSILKANQAYPHPKVKRSVVDIHGDGPNAEFDLVVSFQVIEHLQDVDPFWNFCVEACRPGGHIAVGTPNRDRLDNRIRRLRGEAPILLDPMHAREFTFTELMNSGRERGLAVKSHFGVLLSSLLYPWLTPRPYQRALEWGTRVSRIASGMVVVFRKPD